VEVARETKPGQPLAFTLHGQGVITEPPAETASSATQQQEQMPQSPTPSQDNRPGGGLGVPIDAPDALQQYRWPILGGFALLLVIGGWVVTRRQPLAPASASRATAASPTEPAAPSLSTIVSAAPTAVAAQHATAAGTSIARSSMLLEALKEELFQLEVEKKQGKITPEDYEKARAALDQTLDRALKRQQES
jgi:hypothetical protein